VESPTVLFQHLPQIKWSGLAGNVEAGVKISPEPSTLRSETAMVASLSSVVILAARVVRFLLLDGPMALSTRTIHRPGPWDSRSLV